MGVAFLGYKHTLVIHFDRKIYWTHFLTKICYLKKLGFNKCLNFVSTHTFTNDKTKGEGKIHQKNNGWSSVKEIYQTIRTAKENTFAYDSRPKSS